MLEELDNFAVFVEQVLGEVPFDLGIGSQSLQMAEQRADVVAFHIDFAQDWELGTVVTSDPLLDLLLRPWLLRSKLIAWDGKDL